MTEVPRPCLTPSFADALQEERPGHALLRPGTRLTGLLRVHLNVFTESVFGKARGLRRRGEGGVGAFPGSSHMWVCVQDRAGLRRGPPGELAPEEDGLHQARVRREGIPHQVVPSQPPCTPIRAWGHLLLSDVPPPP